MVLLFLIPLFVTLVLGLVFVTLGSASPAFKLFGIGVFVLAVYLQFFSRFVLAGLLIQVALAFSLALWRRMDTGIR
jgi:hypothetical protein